jgi:hypothetical protein
MAIEEAEREVRGIEVRGWKSDASCRVTVVPRQSYYVGGGVVRITRESGSPSGTPWYRQHTKNQHPKLK